MRTKIDAGHSFLFLCECGTRGEPEQTRMEALTQALAHEQRAHPGDKDVQGQISKQRARDRDALALFVERAPYPAR